MSFTYQPACVVFFLCAGAVARIPTAKAPSATTPGAETAADTALSADAPGRRSAAG